MGVSEKNVAKCSGVIGKDYEFPQTSVARTYRLKLLEVLFKIPKYRGIQAQDEELIDMLAKLEEWMVKVFGDEGVARLSFEKERTISAFLVGRTDRTVDDLLDLMCDRYEKWLHEVLSLSSVESSDVLIEETIDVYLPSDDKLVLCGNGEKRIEFKFENRLEQLLVLLKMHGIFSDDVVVVRGKVDSNMMRQEPYVIVEIPKMRRQILVCDQYGEATFVVRTIFDRAVLANMTKEELLENYPLLVKKVVYRDRDQWEVGIIKHLLQNLNLKALPKIDVRTLEGLRTEIKKQKPTAESWVEMKYRERLEFKVCGMGLHALSTKFGVKGKPLNRHSDHVLLGKTIYGENEVFEEMTLEELREEVKKLKPNVESWVKMGPRERVKFKVGGMGLQALSTKFGVKGSPYEKYSIHLLLGKAIYGAHELFEVKEVTLDELREAAKKQKPTPEEWASMNYKDRKKIRVCGMGVSALATKFGVDAGPNNRSVHLLLGKAIYGDNELFEVKEVTLDELREAVKKQKPTAETWIGLKNKDKKGFRVCGLGLHALATVFGVDAGPNNRSVHLLLGREIYGNNELFEEITLEKLRDRLEKRNVTAEMWAGMGQMEKRKFKVFGLGLHALSTKFGLEGKPRVNHSAHLLFGKLIFGDNRIFEQLTNEQLVEEVKKQYPTAESWAAMKRDEKHSFRVGGMGLLALARRFGVKGNALGRRSVLLALGKEIYGDHDVFDS